MTSFLFFFFRLAFLLFFSFLFYFVLLFFNVFLSSSSLNLFFSSFLLFLIPVRGMKLLWESIESMILRLSVSIAVLKALFLWKEGFERGSFKKNWNMSLLVVDAAWKAWRLSRECGSSLCQRIREKEKEKDKERKKEKMKEKEK